MSATKLSAMGLGILAALAVRLSSAAQEGEPKTVVAPAPVDAGAVEHFEKRVRPLLVERCYKCHAGDEVKGGLHLDSADGLHAGGDSGAAIVTGKPAESLLVQAVRHENGLEMPPDGKLSDVQIADLATWIRSGAVWPASGPTKTSPPGPAAVSPRRPNAGGLAAALQLWLPADALSLADGDPVFTWPDQSGHGRDLTATRGVRPGGVGLPPRFARESKLGRRPSVRFDVASGLAASPGNPVPIEGDAALSLILVLNLEPHESGPPFDGVFGIGNPAHAGDPGKPLAALVQINRGEDHALHLAGGWNHDASLGAGSFRPFYDKSVVLTVVKQPGPLCGTTQFFVNGERLGPAGDGPLAGVATAPDIQHRADIGPYMGKALEWAGSIRGDVGEVVVYSKALSEAERRGVEEYLADKFALTLRSQVIATRAVFTPEERGFWAYQPIANHAPPAVRDETRVRSPVDRFLLTRLEGQNLAFAPPADKRTLLRRVTFDLTGLPPTPEEVEAFLKDESPQAFAGVVNRLLDSPRYGERWGRHWLDVVRYADTTANDANAVMRYSWRYRNYVIDAFNRDLPYDQFVVEQLAGDLLPPASDIDVTIRRTVATGYLMVGSKALAETDKEQSRLDIVDDQLDVTGRALLGLTIGCARCHDHKFDAIRTVDYYALAGIFRSTEPFQDESRNATMWWEFPLFQPPGEAPFMVMAPKEAAPRNLRVHVRGNHFTLGQVVPRGFIQIVSSGMRAPEKGEGSASEAPAGSHPDAPDINSAQSGRLELARWIADKNNPLTARVMVNRIWQHHFGRGLVATSDNFGARGEPPSHPELLDWLAARFIESGWSVKAMHRLMLGSSAYQQQCRPQEAARQVDPDNRLLSYFPRRRLSAEELRDAVLAVSGQLDVVPDAGEAADVLWKRAEILDGKRGFAPNRMTQDDPFYSEFLKRSVYLPIVRNMLPDVLALFDGADPNGVTAVRNETTVPSQALFMLNSRLVREQSRHFAGKLLADEKGTDADRVRRAHEAALGRPPSQQESADALAFVDAYLAAQAAQARPEAERRLSAWQSYCQALFCENEFLYCE
ncbi:MAG TPA: PSD1 and planctomycete cytochrome C domain-containing protein [Pirellulales bacterium]|nr:PSD1 and planctomycete cytochrome C domain-containing protein [Pirellulales bacterium]